MEQERKTPRDRAFDLVTLLVPGWRPTTPQVMWAIRIAIIVLLVLFVLLLILYIIGGLFGIRLLSLLTVLAVPLTIGGAVPLLNWLQKRRELEIENQSAQDTALQAYLGAMSELIIDYNLRTPQSSEDVRTVARVRTATVLTVLDGNRKRRVVQFLYESDLITKDNPIVSLQGHKLSKASLRGLVLTGADLSGTQLDEADLRYANLEQVDLRQAHLQSADLRSANLEQADLRGAFFWGADLRDAHVGDVATLVGAFFGQPDGQPIEKTNLETGEREQIGSAIMPDGQKYENWLKGPENDGEFEKNSATS